MIRREAPFNINTLVGALGRESVKEERLFEMTLKDRNAVTVLTTCKELLNNSCSKHRGTAILIDAKYLANRKLRLLHG